MNYGYCSSDSDDEEYSGMLKKALAVELPDDFDPNSVPTTGEEYLHHVIYERQNKCKKCVRVDIDPSKLSGQQAITDLKSVKDHLKTTQTCPAKFLTTSKWKTQKVHEFTSFRDFLEPKLVTDSCLIIKYEEDEVLDMIENQEINFSDIIRFSVRRKMMIIETVTVYLERLKPGESISDNVGRWTYCMLAILELPLRPDQHHILRELARSCALVRSRLNPDCSEKLYMPLNMIICIVSKFYRQLDLVDQDLLEVDLWLGKYFE